MEEEIQEKLEKIYKFRVEVNFIEFRHYNVHCALDDIKSFIVPFLYDARYTIDANISNLRSRINDEIVNLYLRKEE